MRRLALLAAALLAAAPPAGAAVREYDLEIARGTVEVAGRAASGMTLNGGVPGPVLRFTEGDTARIRVRNDMDVETSVHWHGLLVPPGMDGVPYLSYPPIAPGETFTYEFPIRQSGTYWYHSHTSLQEQRGLYGAIVIDPAAGPPAGEREAVVVLSDWTTEEPQEVLSTLKRGSEWYALEKGAAQSLIGAARLGRLGDFLQRELLRMPPMDVADVAYDYFLANGAPETAIPAAPGETLRVRIVDGSATTFFHLEFAGGPLEIVAADGIDVEPLAEQRVLIGVAETYDVLVRVPAAGAWELRATAHDGSGHASIWIGAGARHAAPTVPRPDLYAAMGHGVSLGQAFALTPGGAMGMPDRDVDAGRFDRPGMAGMAGMADMTEVGETAMHSMGSAEEPRHGAEDSSGDDDAGPAPMAGMEGGMGAMAPMTSAAAAAGEPTESRPPPPAREFGDRFGLLAADVSSAAALATDGSHERPWPPYARLRARSSTAPPADRPVREIRLTLDGDMERYVWFLGKRALSESDDILVRAGEVVRLIMVNRTMMHHPMHLHGQFFRVLNGQGDRAPLKHTVDVAPMSTTVIEFPADETGDWFFHCHLLYHMKTGMARVVHYEGFEIDPALAAIRPALYRDPWYGRADADLLSNMAEARLTLASTRWTVAASGEAGWQGVDGTRREGLLSLERYVNRFWSFFAGAHAEGGGSHGQTPDPAAGHGHAHEDDSAFDGLRAVAGFRTLLPLNVELLGWVDSAGGARGMLEKSLPLTPRLELAAAVRYDTHDLWEGHTDLSWTVTKGLSLLARWHSEYGFGGGLQLRF